MKKVLFIIFLMVPLIVSFPGAAEPEMEEAASSGQGLIASLRVPAVPVCQDEFIVDFILTNTSDKDIKIFERWNSWGAYNWRFEFKDEKGEVVTFNNPQEIWTANGPTIQVIKVKESFIIKGHLSFDNSKLEKARTYEYAIQNKLDNFMPESKSHVNYTKGNLSIRGIYLNLRPINSHSLADDVWPSVWQGTIETGWQEIEIRKCNETEAAPSNSYISEAGALEIARKICQEKGWEWVDVYVEEANSDGRDRYLIQTKAFQDGDQAFFAIDKKTGEVIEAGYSPF